MSSSERGNLYLGTQGFSFDDWVGPFYPSGTPRNHIWRNIRNISPRLRLIRHFTVCRGILPSAAGKNDTPDEFLFAAKFPRLITHDKKLDRAQGDAEHFVRTMQGLGDKLGLLTMQFAYDFTPELFDRLDDFLSVLPEGPRYAVEVRNRQWLTPTLAKCFLTIMSHLSSKI